MPLKIFFQIVRKHWRKRSGMRKLKSQMIAYLEEQIARSGKRSAAEQARHHAKIAKFRAQFEKLTEGG